MLRISTLLMILLLFGCSSVDISQYQNNKPSLSLPVFFNGPLTAHGILKNRSGEVIRYFNVTMTGSWDEQGIGTLDEDFIFDDGEKQKRIWTFAPDGKGSYLASAGDVKEAVPVKTSGNAFFMEYVLNILYNGKPLEVSIDDKMYLVSDKVIINESIMTKFGIDVGYITLTIIKAGNDTGS
ncbi:DUF3833 domain-containing protein [Endozoicomonas sp. SESOKO4]|uniref:DUF3833 domain-containing protein n=1 Tax=Endozoicomonas sp. SESOKO4 TaxID=2828745 RepID=UPI0021489EF4|nr:DUF3833 domain-containing protein [Endozoicomonas sp. SESOKO4]